MAKKISILGSTGSIGAATLDIVRQHPDRFAVLGLAAGSNLETLAAQIKEFQPLLVSVRDEDSAKKLRQMISAPVPEIQFGSSGAVSVATISSVELVVSAIVGAAGLLPTLEAIRHGKTIGLANKESMVIAGEFMRHEANKAGVAIIPIDSEHSAIYQCLQGNRKSDVRKLILTASGGPFLHMPKEQFPSITIEQALKHPNWSMGAKITIDSASMMNKGLEVMEAHWLFDTTLEQIEVCIHPQSIIHSMVEYCDGSVMAQMGTPDMRVPIAYALTGPERIETGARFLDLFTQKELTFFRPDLEKFKCLALAFEVAKKGGTYPAVLNAANEILVEAFLKKRMPFINIPVYLEKVLEKHQPSVLDSLQVVLQADAWARVEAENLL